MTQLSSEPQASTRSSQALQATMPIAPDAQLRMPATPFAIVAIADSALRSHVEAALRPLGCKIVSVADGFHLIQSLADAVLVESSKTRPRLIVADSILAGCTGLNLLKGLRQLGWDTPFILLTPNEDEKLRRLAWQNGATGVFMTPFDCHELGVFAELMLRPDEPAARSPHQSSWLPELPSSEEPRAGVAQGEGVCAHGQ